MNEELARKNRRLILIVLTVILIMGGMAFAAVPLYQTFCRVTGWGGTTQVASALPERVVDRLVRVKFTARIAPDLPWRFRPDIRAVDLKVGQQGLTAFTAKSLTSKTTSGTAVYNVVPPKAGKYFHKVQCFCFAEQTMPPRHEVNMPVLFFIHPDFADDPDMDDVHDITLSYIFYAQDSEGLEQALE